jgi:hypothetical protein
MKAIRENPDDGPKEGGWENPNVRLVTKQTAAVLS